MKASAAREIAQAWVREVGVRLPGFRAAHLSGSLARMHEEDEHPDYSDIDIYCVMEAGAEFPQRKFDYHGALVETVARPLSDYASPESVLSNPYLAPAFLADGALYDSEGSLSGIYPAVREHYAEKQWLEARYNTVRAEVEGIAGSLERATSLDEGFLAVGVTVRKVGLLLAVAHLQAPTVRKSLAESTRLLRSRGRDDLADKMLRVLGCLEITEEQARRCLRECAAAFDRAAEVLVRPAPMDFNLVPAARPYLVGGTEEMIAAGQHREAMVWVMMVLWASNACLQKDAPPEERPRWQERTNRCYALLGLASMGDYSRRASEAKALIRQVISYTDGAVAAYVEDPSQILSIKSLGKAGLI